MRHEYMDLVVMLREGSYIMQGDTAVGFRQPTELNQKAADAIESLVKCAEVTDDHWRKIADELNAYKSIGTVEHFRELIEAEREKRLKIIPAGKYMTCGSCRFFKRTEGQAYGKCLKRQYLSGHGPNQSKRYFIPYQSRKACSKDYAPVEVQENVAE